jgi:hypothetical protein
VNAKIWTRKSIKRCSSLRMLSTNKESRPEDSDAFVSERELEIPANSIELSASMRFPLAKPVIFFIRRHRIGPDSTFQ